MEASSSTILIHNKVSDEVADSDQEDRLSDRRTVNVRRLKRKRVGYRRRKPRLKGVKIHSRFKQPYAMLQAPAMRSRFRFLQNYQYISNLNKAFIRSLRVKITHYRLTRREFFSQYLIRLNPRHVFYKTINYRHFFSSPLSMQIVARLEQSKTLKPKSTFKDLSYYLQSQGFLQNYSFSTVDFNFKGLFAMLNLLQVSSPVDGYKNMTRRKRALRRRK